MRRWSLPLALGIVGLGIFLIGFGTRDRGDYLWYFRCAETAFLAGQSPYNCPDYRNVPPTFLYMAPFGLLPAPYDAAAWSLFVVACVCAGLWLLLQTLRLVERRTVPMLALLVLCPCTLFLLTYQQSTALVFLLEAGAL